MKEASLNEVCHTTIIQFEGVKKRVRWGGVLDKLKSLQKLIETHFRTDGNRIMYENTKVSVRDKQGRVKNASLKEFISQNLMNNAEFLDLKTNEVPRIKNLNLDEKESKREVDELEISSKEIEIRSLKDDVYYQDLSNSRRKPHHPEIDYQTNKKRSQLQTGSKQKPTPKSLKQSSGPKNEISTFDSRLARQTHTFGGERDTFGNSMEYSQSINIRKSVTTEDERSLPILDFTFENISKIQSGANRLIMIHSCRSQKIMTNTISLVPLSGRVVPYLIYNRVKTPEDEAIELTVNPELSLILKYNTNIVSNLTIFIEALNRSNSSEYLFTKMRAEHKSEDILIDFVRENVFSALLKHLECHSETFLRTAADRIQNDSVSADALNLIFGLVYNFYKYRIAKMIPTQKLKNDLISKERLPVNVRDDLK